MSQSLSYFVSQARLEKSKASHTTAYKLQANAMQCMYTLCNMCVQRTKIHNCGRQSERGTQQNRLRQIGSPALWTNYLLQHINRANKGSSTQKMEKNRRNRTLAISFVPRAT